MTHRLVVVESPFAADTAVGLETNLRYLRAAMADCFRHGEAPFASHGLYTQPGVLDDGKPEERKKGIDAGLAWATKADAVIVYVDLGISPGMTLGILRATENSKPVEYRTIPGWKS
jgi:hypothetical protein